MIVMNDNWNWVYELCRTKHSIESKTQNERNDPEEKTKKQKGQRETETGHSTRIVHIDASAVSFGLTRNNNIKNNYYYKNKNSDSSNKKGKEKKRKKKQPRTRPPRDPRWPIGVLAQTSVVCLSFPSSAFPGRRWFRNVLRFT